MDTWVYVLCELQGRLGKTFCQDHMHSFMFSKVTASPRRLVILVSVDLQTPSCNFFFLWDNSASTKITSLSDGRPRSTWSCCTESHLSPQGLNETVRQWRGQRLAPHIINRKGASVLPISTHPSATWLLLCCREESKRASPCTAEGLPNRSIHPSHTHQSPVTCNLFTPFRNYLLRHTGAGTGNRLHTWLERSGAAARESSSYQGTCITANHHDHADTQVPSPPPRLFPAR